MPDDEDQIRFCGSYQTWEEAEALSTGYSAPNILEKTRSSLLKVKNGEAVYERDSVLFDKIEYPYPLLSALLRAASENAGKLSVLDYGGALGCVYFTCRGVLACLEELHWSIVEQTTYVDCGRQDFANQQLHYYESITECLTGQSPNVLLLSGVIDYLPSPYQFLADVVQHRFPYIIFDRTTLLESGEQRLTIQHVPEWIYKAVYPAWFLQQRRIVEQLAPAYDLVLEFPHEFTTGPADAAAYSTGFLFKLKESSPL